MLAIRLRLWLWLVLDAALLAAIASRLARWHGGLTHVDRLRLGFRLADFATLGLALLPVALFIRARRRRPAR